MRLPPCEAPRHCSCRADVRCTFTLCTKQRQARFHAPWSRCTRSAQAVRYVRATVVCVVCLPHLRPPSYNFSLYCMLPCQKCIYQRLSFIHVYICVAPSKRG
jgi:hypothetical protein